MIDHRTDPGRSARLLIKRSRRTPFAHIEALGELILVRSARSRRRLFKNFCALGAAGDRRDRPSPLFCARAARIGFGSADEMLQAMRPLLPYGWGMNEEMLVPVTAETLARAGAAARDERRAAGREHPAAAARHRGEPRQYGDAAGLGDDGRARAVAAERSDARADLEDADDLRRDRRRPRSPRAPPPSSRRAVNRPRRRTTRRRSPPRLKPRPRRSPRRRRAPRRRTRSR